jgi:hypothetical protein
MRAPGRLRPLVAASWQRSARVDPDAAPVLALDDDELDAARHDGPIATLLPVVRRLLLDDSRSAGCVVAVGDAAGRLVWVDGARSTRRAAEDMGFVPGADWSEDRVGTSAPGTALRLDRPVQIRSDEHYANAVKPFSCTAVPVHDASGATVGVLDLTGDDRAVERHTLSLLAATVAAAEAQIALATVRSRARTPRVPSAELTVLGTDTAVLRVSEHRAADHPVSEHRVELSARHSELLVVLAAHPAGLAASDLASAVYGDPGAVVTLRAEVVRLRRVLAQHAPDVTVTSRPYRVTGVRTDVDGVLSALERGARLQAVDRYAGSVLPGSAAPGVDAVRDLVRLRFRESVVADGGVGALLAWARTPDGATDALVLRALLAVVPRRSPRRAGLVAAIEALEGS